MSRTFYTYPGYFDGTLPSTFSFLVAYVPFSGYLDSSKYRSLYGRRVPLRGVSMPQFNYSPFIFALLSSHLSFFISIPYLATSSADLSFVRGWVECQGHQPSRRSQLPKTFSVSVTFVLASCKRSSTSVEFTPGGM